MSELKIYGVTEVADAIGVRRVDISVWLFRGNHGIPEPDERLSRGAVWLAKTIRPWIKAMNAEKEES